MGPQAEALQQAIEIFLGGILPRPCLRCRPDLLAEVVREPLGLVLGPTEILQQARVLLAGFVLQVLEGHIRRFVRVFQIRIIRSRIVCLGRMIRGLALRAGMPPVPGLPDRDGFGGACLSPAVPFDCPELPPSADAPLPLGLPGSPGCRPPLLLSSAARFPLGSRGSVVPSDCAPSPDLLSPDLPPPDLPPASPWARSSEMSPPLPALVLPPRASLRGFVSGRRRPARLGPSDRWRIRGKHRRSC